MKLKVREYVTAASQRKDIHLAQRFWRHYLEMTHHGKGE
jgi:hypothetical protein